MNQLLLALVVAGAIVCLFSTPAHAAGRCDSQCSNEPSCASGQCTLTNCVETDQCFTFCLNCNGQVTCYASGAFCTSAARKTTSTFSLFAISVGLVAARCF